MTTFDWVALFCAVGVALGALYFAVWNCAVYTNIRDEQRLADALRKREEQGP